MHYFFFSLNTAMSIHQDLVDTYGGSQGVRDKELLISALAQVKSTFNGEYLHKSIYEMAAAYLFHIIQNHPFIDGKKRTGIMLAMIFQSLHGIDMNCEEKQLDQYVFRVANGKESKKEISSWLEKNSRSRK